MKVAVSVPDDVFELAERLAHRMHVSRSRLYSLALHEYVARHDPDAVKEAVDRVCDGLDSRPDDFVDRAARDRLEAEEW
mgnify:CR=1 FL=1